MSNSDAKQSSNTNTHLWDQLKVTDPRFTKDFTKVGGFRGTAVSPLYYVKRLTEQFGPVGQGWGFEENDQKIVDLTPRMIVYIQGRVWWKNPEDQKVYYTPYAWGGDFIATMGKNGPMYDDDAFKKAATDAFSKAVTYLGLGADVHLGFFDDNKYVETATKYTANKEAQKKEASQSQQTSQSQEAAPVAQNTGQQQQPTPAAASTQGEQQAQVEQVHSITPPLGQVRARIRKTPLEGLNRLLQWAQENYSEADMNVIACDIENRKQALSA